MTISFQALAGDCECDGDSGWRAAKVTRSRRPTIPGRHSGLHRRRGRRRWCAALRAPPSPLPPGESSRRAMEPRKKAPAAARHVAYAWRSLLVLARLGRRRILGTALALAGSTIERGVFFLGAALALGLRGPHVEGLGFR